MEVENGNILVQGKTDEQERDKILLNICIPTSIFAIDDLSKLLHDGDSLKKAFSPLLQLSNNSSNQEVELQNGSSVMSTPSISDTSLAAQENFLVDEIKIELGCVALTVDSILVESTSIGIIWSSQVISGSSEMIRIRKDDLWAVTVYHTEISLDRATKFFLWKSRQLQGEPKDFNVLGITSSIDCNIRDIDLYVGEGKITLSIRQLLIGLDRDEILQLSELHLRLHDDGILRVHTKGVNFSLNALITKLISFPPDQKDNLTSVSSENSDDENENYPIEESEFVNRSMKEKGWDYFRDFLPDFEDKLVDFVFTMESAR